MPRDYTTTTGGEKKTKIYTKTNLFKTFVETIIITDGPFALVRELCKAKYCRRLHPVHVLNINLIGPETFYDADVRLPRARLDLDFGGRGRVGGCYDRVYHLADSLTSPTRSRTHKFRSR